MIKKYLHKALSVIPVEEAQARVSEANRKLGLAKQREDELRSKIILAESRQAKSARVIAADVGDPEPRDEEQRMDYVAQAANFYDAILEQKLLQMIAQVREQEDTIFAEVPPGMTRVEYDYVLKGTSNAFKLLMDWGEIMRGEHQSNIRVDTNE